MLYEYIGLLAKLFTNKSMHECIERQIRPGEGNSETARHYSTCPHVLLLLPLSAENLTQRISLIRERINAVAKESSQRGPNCNNLLIKHRQGPLVPFQGP